MRIWDIAPGYLNRGSLLGEHRELHAIFAILQRGSAGYAHHPETLRWRGSLAALPARHNQLVAEMRLRGYQHHSPLEAVAGEPVWPDRWVDEPARQFEILAGKYVGKEPGRIALPTDTKQLLEQHRYSLMLREAIWPEKPEAFADVAQRLTLLLRTEMLHKQVRPVLELLCFELTGQQAAPVSDRELFGLIRRWQTVELAGSTALAELNALFSVA